MNRKKKKNCLTKRVVTQFGMAGTALMTEKCKLLSPDV